MIAWKYGSYILITWGFFSLLVALTEIILHGFWLRIIVIVGLIGVLAFAGRTFEKKNPFYDYKKRQESLKHSDLFFNILYLLIVIILEILKPHLFYYPVSFFIIIGVLQTFKAFFSKPKTTSKIATI